MMNETKHHHERICGGAESAREYPDCRASDGRPEINHE
jgi:hypothetical protein